MKRKPITAREMEAAYNRCLRRERDRERKWKLTKQGAFEGSVVHFDMEAEEAHERQNSVSWLSDRGKGARHIYRALDPRPDQAVTRQRRLDRAKHLIARNAPECLKVFWLILKNGSNRKESIWQLVKDSKRPKTGTSKRPSIGTR